MSFVLRLGGKSNGISMWDHMAGVPQPSQQNTNYSRSTASGSRAQFERSNASSYSYDRNELRYNDDLLSWHSGRTGRSYSDHSGTYSSRRHERCRLPRKFSRSPPRAGYESSSLASYDERSIFPQPRSVYETSSPVFIPAAAPGFLFVPAATANRRPDPVRPSQSPRAVPYTGPHGFCNSEKGRERFEADRQAFEEGLDQGDTRGRAKVRSDKEYHSRIEGENAGSKAFDEGPGQDGTGGRKKVESDEEYFSRIQKQNAARYRDNDGSDDGSDNGNEDAVSTASSSAEDRHRRGRR